LLVPQNESSVSGETNACLGGGGTGAINRTGLYGHPPLQDKSSVLAAVTIRKTAFFLITTPCLALSVMAMEKLKINDSHRAAENGNGALLPQSAMPKTLFLTQSH